MKKLFLIFLISFASFESTYSQYWMRGRFEVYFGFATSSFFGDIGGSPTNKKLLGIKDITLGSSRPGVSFGAAFRLEERFYIRVSCLYGDLFQTDKGSKNEKRDFEFNTVVKEASVQGMYFLIRESNPTYYLSFKQLFGSRKNLDKRFSLYAFMGIGGVFFNVKPQRSYIGSERFDPNHSFAMQIPLGIGAKFAFSPRFFIASELGRRLTFSDYLDGFSSASSRWNDVYYVLNLKAIYRFQTKKRRF